MRANCEPVSGSKHDTKENPPTVIGGPSDVIDETGIRKTGCKIDKTFSPILQTRFIGPVHWTGAWK